MSVRPEASDHHWPIPPAGGWTADDLDRIPRLPPHTELIDGSLVFASPQTVFHTRALSFFERHLDAAAPPHLEVLREFSIDIDPQNRPEPDVVIVLGDAIAGPGQTRLPAEAVKLALEVVSPESRSRDRETKPVKYARAGIRHYWRVENDEGRAVVYVFELEPVSRTYAPTGIFRDRLKTSVPYPLDLDLTEITARRVAPEG
ncbi:Uma2 family endonuclease [Streptacidiphilus rugosus]|uniref:Uma2 family endonuclease n=1 Tax=Streptacidiphilus rugosus TaxID=405783 RepID=UPI00055C6548|nr:Uma2 family endonuclease [Streptacidiphilus rugosus]